MRFLKSLSVFLTILSLTTNACAFADAGIDQGAGGVDNGDCCNPCPRQCGITLCGEFLYWKVIQDQTQYALVVPDGVQPVIQALSETPIQISERFSVRDPKFKFRPGFRVGVGYALPCSDWDFRLLWTHIDEKVTSRVFNKNNGIIPITIPAASAFGFTGDPEQFGFGNKAHSRWRFDFDVIDFEVGKKCCCDCLVFHPYTGLRAAFIDQTQRVRYFGFSVVNDPTLPVSLKNKKKNNFYGVGPSVGFDASWEFCDGFSLSGGVSGALLWGRFDVREHPSIKAGPNHIAIKLKNSKKHRIRPVVDANIGIDWSYCLCGFPLVVGLYYEVEYWWNQWQVSPSFVSSILNGGSSPQGDLMMHGLTVKLAVGF